MIRKLTIAACLLSSMTASAGMWGPTSHSRANCVNNESITWWSGHPYTWRVTSEHYNIHGIDTHKIDTGYTKTWRQAAVHWNEAPLNQHTWIVNGAYYMRYFATTDVLTGTESVNDCSIYDGWWD